MIPGPHGGDPGDAFDLGDPVGARRFLNAGWQPGWEVGRTTAAFAELMARLGYSRYGAHGGDIGAGISGRLGATDAAHVVGTPWSATLVRLAGEQFPIPDHLTEEDRARRAGTHDLARGTRLPRLQGHRPETIAAALTDSPVGQLAWIVEKFHLDQPGVEDSGRGGGSRSAADQRQPLLVHPERC